MMDTRKSDIIKQLTENRGEVVAFFRPLSPEVLALRVYPESPAWTVKQVLAHFVTIERSMHWLFKNILSGGPGSPKDFDIDRFNRTQPKKLDEHSLEELTLQFEEVRAETISIVEKMSQEDLQRIGWHVFHGNDTLERFVRWAYEHVNLHLDDIRKVIRAGVSEFKKKAIEP
jgi:uncharacterized damage-inducible protein DinB